MTVDNQRRSRAATATINEHSWRKSNDEENKHVVMQKRKIILRFCILFTFTDKQNSDESSTKKRLRTQTKHRNSAAENERASSVAHRANRVQSDVSTPQPPNRPRASDQNKEAGPSWAPAYIAVATWLATAIGGGVGWCGRVIPMKLGNSSLLRGGHRNQSGKKFQERYKSGIITGGSGCEAPRPKG